MQGKYKVITLCGSTKFKDEFFAEQKRHQRGNVNDKKQRRRTLYQD